MRIRLKAPFFFQNHLYQPGEIVDLPDGVQGPHKSRTVSHDKIDYGTNDPIDANRMLGEVALEALYEEVVEEPAPTADEGRPIALLEKPDPEKSAAAEAEFKD